MPDAYSTLREVGLWMKSDIPTEPARELLLHLASSGEPRLYVQDKGNYSIRASTSNSETAAGFTTKVDVENLVRQAFLEIDKEVTEICASSIKAYRISDKGREALAQAAAYAQYELIVRTQLPDLLEHYRYLYKPKP